MLLLCAKTIGGGWSFLSYLEIKNYSQLRIPFWLSPLCLFTYRRQRSSAIQNQNAVWLEENDEFIILVKTYGKTFLQGPHFELTQVVIHVLRF